MRRALRPSLLSGLTLLTAVLAAAVAVGVALAAVQIGRTIAQVSSEPLRDVEVRLPGASPATGIAGQIARGERVTLLLLGYGGGDHDGAYLADSVMVASLEPRSGLATLVSIPRDLIVTIPRSKYAAAFQAKINEVFAIGAAKGDRDEGLRLADQVVEQVTGLGIDRSVAVDFRAFRTVVDAIGGIDLVVDRPFDALYPANDDPNVDPSWIVVSFREGPQHMGGEAALRFARARYSDGPEGSDFARAVRQQKVVLAAREKVFGVNAVAKLFDLLGALRENVRTDLSIADLQALAEWARAYDDGKTIRGAITPPGILQRGSDPIFGYHLVPKVVGWSEVNAYVRRLIEYPESAAEDASVVVRVSPGLAGNGYAAVARLFDLGLRASLEFVQDADPASTLVEDSTGGRATATSGFLAAYFKGTNGATARSSTVVTVRLGFDWRPPNILVLPEPEPTATPTPRAPPTPRP